MTSLLDANLAAHRVKWGFAPAVEVDDSSIRVEAAEGAWPRVSIRVPDGRWLRVHSDRQPLDEAARALALALDTDDANAKSLVCVIGGGYGYALDVLESKAPQTLKILLIEPEPAFLRHFLGRRDWTPLIDAGRLLVLAAPAYEGRTEAWRLVSPEAPDPPIVIHPVIATARQEAAKEATRIAAQAVLGARANDEARRQFAGPYLLNTLRNLAHIVAGPDPGALRGRFAGVPAVIAGAGPSLNDTLPALRTLQARALVIAADTAWRPLAAGGVDPTLVVATDPSELNGRHLLDIPSRHETWIIAEGSVDPQALSASAGRVATFRVAMHHPWPWLQTAGIERPFLRVWGSVLTAAFDLALTLGCDPIVFVGADLAYTDERTHCRGTTFERDWACSTAVGISLREIWRASLRAHPTVTAPGLGGRDVLTAPRLVEFRNWLVARTTEQPTRRFINATGAGTLFGPRIEQLDLQSALGDQPPRDSPIRDILRQVLRPVQPSETRRVVLEAISALTRTGGSASGPVADWLVFGRPALTREGIYTALNEGQRALVASQLPSESHDRLGSARSPLRLHAADRAARMCALLTGSDTSLDGLAEPIDLIAGRSVESVRADITHIVGVLLGMCPLVTGGDAHSDAPRIPLSWRFPWTPEASSLVAQLEEAILALASSFADTEVRLTRGAEAGFWSGPILPVHDSDVPVCTPAPPPDVDWLARLAVMHAWLEASGQGAQHALPERIREQRLVDAMTRGLNASDVWSPTEPRVWLDLDVPNWSQPRPLAIGAFMRALTGTVAVPSERAGDTTRKGARMRLTSPDTSSAAGLAEPRLAFLEHAVATVEPEPLTDRGFPQCWACATAGAQYAIVTPAQSLHSYRVFEDGHFEANTDWPVEINGEVPWGEDGGALAWAGHKSMLLMRARDSAEPLVTKIPFRPRWVAAGLGEVALCLQTGGGLWRWCPGGPPQFAIATPECAGIYLEGDAEWLTPIPRNAQGRFVRRRGHGRLRYDRVHHALREEPCGPAGHQTSVTTHGEWTAAAYLYSDLIGLTHTDGRSMALACYAPLRAAWCGRSLLVITADAAVLFFRDLITRIEDATTT